MSKQMAVVIISLLDRRDGGLRIYSETLPELLLSGPNKRDVYACVKPAIRTIFAQHGHMVTAISARKPARSENALISSKNSDFKLEQQFMVEYQDAA
jgi:hypothetical protein